MSEERTLKSASPILFMVLAMFSAKKLFGITPKFRNTNAKTEICSTENATKKDFAVLDPVFKVTIRG